MKSITLFHILFFSFLFMTSSFISFASSANEMIKKHLKTNQLMISTDSVRANSKTR